MTATLLLGLSAGCQGTISSSAVTVVDASVPQAQPDSRLSADAFAPDAGSGDAMPLGDVGAGIVVPDEVPGTAQAEIFVGATQQTGYPVSLDGSSSVGMSRVGERDRYGIERYWWNFGDGSPVETSPYFTTVTHVFAAAGSYTVTLTVAASDGSVDATSTTVTIGTLARRTATGGNVSAAIEALGGPGIVVVPEGRWFPGVVQVPEGVVIEGAGADRTVLEGVTFDVRGDNSRITGVEIAGNGSNAALYMAGRHNLLIDHCDIHHHEQTTHVSDFASLTIEDSYIHDNDVAGFGYGLQLARGAYAMVRRSRFERSRHAVAAGGQSGPYVLFPTGYDLIGNVFRIDPVNRDATIDMHPTGHGRIRIVGNVIEDVRYGIGLKDGWGEIRGNTFRRVGGWAILCREPRHNGTLVEGGGCFHLAIEGNTFDTVGEYYRIEYGTDVTIEGRSVDPPHIGNAPP